MPDLVNSNRKLFIKRYEHAKLVALSQVHAREIRIMELEEEVIRLNTDIIAQQKIIADSEANIELQLKEIERENEENKATEEAKA